MPAPRAIVFAHPWQRNSEPVGARIAELLKWLGARVGRTIVPRLALSYEELLTMFTTGAADFAWLPPIVHLRLLSERRARTLLVNRRHGEARYCAVLVSRKGSRYDSIDSLAGARMAWVDPWSASGYVLQRIALHAHGTSALTTFLEERFRGSHDAAVRAVADDFADVAATFAELRDGRIVRASYTTWADRVEFALVHDAGESPSDVLAARADFDPLLASALRDAAIAAVDDADGRVLLRDALAVDGFDEGDRRFTSLAEELARAKAAGLFPYL